MSQIKTRGAGSESEDFNEIYYLGRNRDVATEVRRGTWKSGLEHYLTHGRAEGRLPCAPKPSPGERSLEDLYLSHNGSRFLSPNDLSVNELPIRKVALIGSCFLESWGFHKRNPSGCTADLIVVNNAGELPDVAGTGSASDYDCAVIQIPLRSVLKDAALWHLPHDSIELYEQAFKTCCDYLAFQLKSRMQWNCQYGMLSFVSNFFLPQRNPMGCLFPRFDLRNPEFFVEKLNEHLESLVAKYSNAFVLDVDRIAASLGRRFVQDDLIALHSHNALLATPGVITSRIEPMDTMLAHFEVTWPAHFSDALWTEIETMYRTVRQVDSVKLVVVDLDDTLWNGISGEMAEVDPFMVEGWPLGFVEALCYLRKRGILLAIVSKNEEERIRDIWPKIFRGRIGLEDFAAIRINWKPKAANLAEILSAMCILPRSVVFIDDNPVERAAIKHAFPEVRLLGRHPYYFRQTLLWSSETQVVSVTGESNRRTEMIKAQLQRESQRTEMSRAEFLVTAAPTVKMIRITSVAHPRYSRALELINKTNQFNTTGRRWKSDECDGFLRAGGVFLGFEVDDAYTGYGLVGVVLLQDRTIIQWVMSCRILGYQIEDAVMATIVPTIRANEKIAIRAHLVETEVNFPCRDLFSKCGFAKAGADWVLPATTELYVPEHIKIL